MEQWVVGRFSFIRPTPCSISPISPTWARWRFLSLDEERNLTWRVSVFLGLFQERQPQSAMFHRSHDEWIDGDFFFKRKKSRSGGGVDPFLFLSWGSGRLSTTSLFLTSVYTSRRKRSHQHPHVSAAVFLSFGG